ncbi:MAG TPA: hypothetical protein VNT52_01015 [Acidimicrobiales bacterium]|nr:hypothetical protein [Acidimicrobiales bacterium]
MKIAIDYAAAWLLLWLFYLAVMALKNARNRGTLTPIGKAFGYPVLFVGLALNVAANLTLYSVLLLELPKRGEWLVSQRTKRHFRHGHGWRQKVAAFIAVHFLNPFDPAGTHV